MTLESNKTGVLEPGDLVAGTYEIERLLCRSHSSIVYFATNRMLAKDVVLKVLSLTHDENDEARIQRFLQEARAASRLEHENLVRTFASGRLEDGSFYIVMERVAGETLEEYLRRNKTLSIPLFRSLFLQLLSGLAFAHEHRLLHRDIKPANIFLSEDHDRNLICKLGDFGIAKILGENGGNATLTKTNDLLGSPAYMSPEQCNLEELDVRSDIYSLGCVMYECLAGRAPFIAESSYELMYKQVHAKTVTLSRFSRGSPKDLISLVERSMRKKASDRYASADELRCALETLDLNQRAEKSTGSALGTVLFLLVVAGLSITALNFWTSKHQVDSISKKEYPSLTEKWTDSKVHFEELPAEALTHATFDETQKALSSGNLNLAFKLTEKLLSADEPAYKGHVEACYSYYYFMVHDFKEALNHARRSEELALKHFPGIKNGAFAEDFDNSISKEISAYTRLRNFAAARKLILAQEKRLETIDRPDDLQSIVTNKIELLLAEKKATAVLELCNSAFKSENLSREQAMNILPLKMKAAVMLGQKKSLEESTKTYIDLINGGSEPLWIKDSFYLVLAEPYMIGGDWKKARYFIQQASDKSKEHVFRSSDSACFLYRALVDAASKRLSTSYCELQKAIAIQEKYLDREVLASYLLASYLCFQAGREAEADAYIKKALELEAYQWTSLRPEIQIAEVNLYLADKLMEMGEKSAAKRCLEQLELLPYLSPKQEKALVRLKAEFKAHLS